MPENVKEVFLESSNVVSASPRAAAALLRLGMQKLMVYLGEKGRDINYDIAQLVKKGLPERLQKALDAVHVTGSNAVRPGEIDSRDDIDTAVTLFDLLNMIVEVMISHPKKVNELYRKLPNSSTRLIRKKYKKRKKKQNKVKWHTIFYR